MSILLFGGRSNRPGGLAGVWTSGRRLLLLRGGGAPLQQLRQLDPVGGLPQIARDGMVPARELELLIEDFANQFSAGLNLLVSAREFEDLLTGVIPPEQAPADAATAPDALDPWLWARISQLPEAVLAEYLTEEHPQTVALIISKLETAKAAKVMSEFPAELRDEAMRRMLASRPATEAGLLIVARALQEDLLENAARDKGDDPHERLARIINNMDRDHMEGFLQSLGDARPQSAEILKGMLFSFEDLAQMMPQARTTLLDNVQSDRLTLALKGTEADFREAVLSALPARARRVVESELARNEAAPRQEVAEARREIVNTALELAGRGEIQLKASSEQQSDLMVA